MSASAPSLPLLRVLMMGTGTFAEPIFTVLLDGPHSVVGLVTQPDREVGQERGSTRQTGRGMKQIAQERNIPVYQAENINTAESIEAVRAFHPDVLVVAAYGQILSKETLAAAVQGGINVHASLLPKYRGAAPVAWAIARGETTTGVSIIRMSVSLDAGDILAQEAIPIGPDETAGELEARLSVLGVNLALQVLDQMALGKVHGTKQDPAQVTKAPKLTKQHGLIDWTRSAQDVCNHIRAMQPWPTAYSFLHRRSQPPIRLIINKAIWTDRPDASHYSPGQVIISPQSSQRLQVAAGEGGAVDILEVQPAGKRRMAAGEFLRGRMFQSGDHFGPEQA